MASNAALVRSQFVAAMVRCSLRMRAGTVGRRASSSSRRVEISSVVGNVRAMGVCCLLCEGCLLQ